MQRVSVGALQAVATAAVRNPIKRFLSQIRIFKGNPVCSRNRHVLRMPFRQIMRQISADARAAGLESRGNTYEEAVKTLNTLQSNAAYIEKSRAERDRRRHLSLPETIQTLSRADITVEDIDGLSVIHVTGTKGKGSTCAFCESILRAHGYKTGFFSSPHLVEVRERIRINGRPISRSAFSSYFWDVYQKILSTKNEYGGNMPPYFRFLTVMAFHVFLKEQVDVAIMEVGIGGEFDCTNIVRSPVVCGVSSLGMDHMGLLGDTLDHIAWHKAGIFKYGVPAVTVSQPDNSIEVLHNRALEKKCPLYFTPASVNSHDWSDHPRALGIPGNHQESNAVLAIQLCTLWLENHAKSMQERVAMYSDYTDGHLDRKDYRIQAKPTSLTEQFIQGLRECSWAGRCQQLDQPGISYYLDGAHTGRSIQACARWFTQASKEQAATLKGKVVRVLLFNATGDRKPETLLEHLLKCHFDCAVFCPNITSSMSLNKADQSNFMVTTESQLAKSRNSRSAWLHLQVCDSHTLSNQSSTSTQNPCTTSSINGQGKNPESSNGHSVPEKLRVTQNGDIFTHSSDHRQQDCQAAAFGSILEAMQWISQGRGDGVLESSENIEVSEALREADHVQVLCTGSLHLVGGILGLLVPDFCDKL